MKRNWSFLGEFKKWFCRFLAIMTTIYSLPGYAVKPPCKQRIEAIVPFRSSALARYNSPVTLARERLFLLYAVEVVQDYIGAKHESYGGVLTEKAKTTIWTDYTSLKPERIDRYIKHMSDKLNLLRFDTSSRKSVPKFPAVSEKMAKLIKAWEASGQADAMKGQLQQIADSDGTPTVNFVGDRPVWYQLSDIQLAMYKHLESSSESAFKQFESGRPLKTLSPKKLGDFSWVLSDGPE